MKRFTDLGVKPEIVKALEDENLYNPTNIQEQSIPAIHEGKDLIGMSRTGSGKTAAFGIPILEKVQKSQGLQAVILTPTRELAVQISRELIKWGKYTELKVCTVYGGVAYEPQIESLKTSEIMVGTPGRVLDIMEKGFLKLNKISTFVLDEADKMVEMGFIEDIERIIQPMPKDRQIILFGATISGEIEHIKKTHMKDPVTAESALHVEKDLLKQYYYEISHHEKFSLLVHLLKKEETDRVMIFCSSRSTVELIYKNLRHQNIRAEMIHGKLSQNKRQRVIDGFNKGKPKILIASAVAARGLDIQDVTHVFNYDLSQDPQEYIHRVGRTARAGAEGIAFTLLSERDHDTFDQIMRRYNIPAILLPKESFTPLRFETGVKKRFGDKQDHQHRGSSSGGYKGNNSSGSSFGRSQAPAKNRLASSGWNA
ncbi:DEAD/DEAH box helicase [Candidatus Woesearchaeota archaeon]|nr:DEAD/DEAH box helicase [Candidatus Woesearchaeota archaeon]